MSSQKFARLRLARFPLHVESVAWVSERKDVLSGCFWLLTMAAYVRYTERPGVGRYVVVVLALCLGLMAKPMLVTLPFVLLLLDYWPLGRLQMGQPSRAGELKIQGSSPLSLIREKIPLMVLVVVSCLVTLVAQQTGGAVKSFAVLPLNIRIANALLSYVSYMGKMIWPHDLAVFYPHRGILPMWQGAGAGLLLVGLSVLVVSAARRHPYLAVGWLWYLGTLVPVIGLVQTGSQAIADRYTYVPLIGVFIIIAWGVPELLVRWRHKKKVLAITAATLFSIFAAITVSQLRYWANNITLFEHTLQVTHNNAVAQYNLDVVSVKARQD